MAYPQQSKLSRPCPSCGSALVRKTVDQAKPLGIVACTGCAYTSPIADFAQTIQAAVMAKAQARLDEEK